MATFAPMMLIFPITFLLLITIQQSKAALHAHYYDQTCPQAEKIVSETIRNASIYDLKVPARILRMFFHDCFIRGCDASVLLDSTPQNQDFLTNISLGSFYVMDDAKAKLEKACPHTVSCADSGEPYWDLLKGRKDGRVSKASETINLPAPTFNVTQLIQSFSNRGLSVKDMVALSGGHTLGFSHCSSFESRLRNFSCQHDIDPSMNLELARNLRNTCPKPNVDRNAGQVLDSTSSTFDNYYYKQLVVGRGVFGSDQSLFGDFRTRWIVGAFANNERLFFREFASSIVRLGSVGVIENGEVRVKCRVVN
ncbi:hypothetical protein Ddye_013590 [Dipteronia dyeriana]|uniref:Peroxidase n=1 Tax=Dipteronia dyeriana TaxID=168575 RepID=A0AAD9X6J6_9ROSI|nr:hypothetical protein Ddye_013590 [Dipteronia dyeriana]